MNHITTSQDCQSAVTLLETSLKLGLNETVGKHAPKVSRFKNLPSISQTANIHEMTYNQLESIHKAHLEITLEEWQSRVLALNPQHQLNI